MAKQTGPNFYKGQLVRAVKPANSRNWDFSGWRRGEESPRRVIYKRRADIAQGERDMAMRITESRLRRIIREELGKKKYQFDIPYDIFVSRGHPRPGEGDDVTDLFKDDLMPPLSAVVVKPEGPRIVAGVADPVVEFEFTDGANGYAWAFNYGIVRNRDEFYSAAHRRD